MMYPPWRSNDPNLVVGFSIGLVFMSATDFYCSVDKIKGVDGNNRVVVTLDGKYLSHSEQRTENMVSRLNLKGSTSECKIPLHIHEGLILSCIIVILVLFVLSVMKLFQVE